MPDFRSSTRLAVVILALAVSPVWAADDAGSKPSKLGDARSAIEAGQWDKAIGLLGELNQEKPKDADVLNLLGYSHRKAGRLDEAHEFYQKALAIEPKHRGANEYLGELYLEKGDLAKAEERLSVLDKACFFPCKEFKELEAAIDEFKKAK